MIGAINGGGAKAPLIQHGKTGTERSVTFKKEFKNPPIISLTMESSDPYTIYHAHVTQVTTKGFTFSAIHHQGSGSAGGLATLESCHWIAIGEEK